MGAREMLARLRARKKVEPADPSDVTFSAVFLDMVGPIFMLGSFVGLYFGVGVLIDESICVEEVLGPDPESGATCDMRAHIEQVGEIYVCRCEIS